MEDWRPVPWHTEYPELVLPSVDHIPFPKGIYCPLDQSMEVPQVDLGGTYTLTEEEVAQCTHVARERMDKNKRAGSKNLRYSRFKDDYTIHFVGVCGELAFCRLFKRPIEIFDTTCRNAHNDLFDARMPNGETVDVKTTDRDDADLLVLANKEVNPADLYVLMIRVSPGHIVDQDVHMFSFRGFVRGKGLFTPENLSKPGRYMNDGRHYRAYQSELCTWEQLQ